MTYPKPLSQKSLSKKYEEAKLTQEKIDFLQKFFLACSNLYGSVPIEHMWKIYKKLKEGIDIPVIIRKDLVNFSAIARREEHPYYVFEDTEIYEDGENSPLWRTVVNKQLVKYDYGKFRALFEVIEQQTTKPYYIPDNLLDYAEPKTTQAEKDLRKFLNSLKVTAKQGKDTFGDTKPTENLGKTLKEFDFLTSTEQYDLDYYKKRPAIIAKILEETAGPESAKLLRKIKFDINIGIDYQMGLRDLTRELEEVGVELSEKQLKKLLNLYMEFNNTSHLMSNRGWAPHDLFEEQRKSYPGGKMPMPAISLGPGIKQAIANGDMDEDELMKMFAEKGIKVIK